MPTRPKSTAVLGLEKKSHRTKAELKQRAEAEKSLLSGVELRERPEVAKNVIAHEEFLRINALLTAVKKNDAIYEAVINRYCMLQAECVTFMQKQELFTRQLEKLLDDDGVSAAETYKTIAQMQKNIIDIDKQVQAKRRMLFDIERENGMTIAAALRSIPKDAADKSNPLLDALNGTD